MKEKFGGIKSKADMTEEEKEALDDFVKKSLVVLDLPTELFRNESQTNGIVLKQANTAAVKSLSDSEFNTIEQIKQGATTLNSILSGSAANEVTGSMLDMEGRKSAVETLEVSF